MTNYGMLSSPWAVSNVKSIRTQGYNYNDNGNTTDFQQDIGITDQSDKDVSFNKAVDSTAIQSARFDPSDNSLNITYRNSNGKEYKFAADGDDAAEWLDAPSKGRITQEWRTTHRYPGY